MINLLLGRPGSGKSYEAVVFHVLTAINEGRKVITNLPLNLEVFKAFFPDSAHLIDIRTRSVSKKLHPFSHIDDFDDDWRGANNVGPLYIIDECHKMFPASGTPREIDEWFAEHRHLGVDVLLITQSYRKISRSIVDMVQVVYRLSNARTLGTDKSYIREVQDGVRGAILSTQVRSYDPSYFKFYQSHTKSNSAVTESTVKDIRPIWMSWPFVGAALFLGIGLPFFIYNVAFNNPITKPLDNAKSANFIDLQSADYVSPVQSSSIESKPPIPSQKQATSELDPVLSKAPFAAVQLHIAGFVRYTSGSRKGSYEYQFIASQNGQPVFYLSQADLISAGYTIAFNSTCSALIEYKGSEFYVLCDSPKVGSNPSSNFKALGGSGEGSRPAGGAPTARPTSL